jgi:hypothetical protein
MSKVATTGRDLRARGAGVARRLFLACGTAAIKAVALLPQQLRFAAGAANIRKISARPIILGLP